MITKTDIIFVVAKLTPHATASTVRKELAILEGRKEPRSLAEMVARLSRLEKEGLLLSRKAQSDGKYREGTKLYKATKEGKQQLMNLVKQAEKIREIPSIAASLKTA